MTVMSVEEFKEICDEIDRQTLIQLKKLILEKIPENNPYAAMMYILNRVVAKSIYGIRPDKETREKLVDELGKNVKEWLESIKDVTV